MHDQLVGVKCRQAVASSHHNPPLVVFDGCLVFAAKLTRSGSIMARQVSALQIRFLPPLITLILIAYFITLAMAIRPLETVHSAFRNLISSEENCQKEKTEPAQISTLDVTVIKGEELETSAVDPWQRVVDGEAVFQRQLQVFLDYDGPSHSTNDKHKPPVPYISRPDSP
ncbi:hypothetical protein O6H91_19G039500 [Diphasiastrum complanatum]|uniref:Uncharacterized protein n=1 Tax=Diphasiastrum complanatum TaxID=34168 RepID=A0ACC2AUB5_DIPCM|nr:hypothetical protein O6H91_19G039500 [Diphasiastrum complanatum]